MSESALRDWGADKGSVQSDQVAHEGDIVGADVDTHFDGAQPEGELNEEPPVEGGPGNPQGKKSKKPLLIGLGVAVVLMIAAGVYKKTQHPAGNPMMGVPPSEESVEGAVASPTAVQQVQPGAAVAPPAAGDAQIAPLIGVDPSASSPADQPVTPVQGASMPVVSQAPAPALAPLRTMSPGQAPAMAPAPAGAGAAEMAAVQEAQKQLVAGLQADVAELRKTVSRLQGELAARPMVHAAPAPKPTAPRPTRTAETRKPVSAESDKPQPVVAAAPSPAPAPVAPAKSKVRSDYRIYAVVEGRVWVKQGDNESEMVDPRSPLMDGTTVLAVNADDKSQPVVVTSAGEIRTR